MLPSKIDRAETCRNHSYVYDLRQTLQWQQFYWWRHIIGTTWYMSGYSWPQAVPVYTNVIICLVNIWSHSGSKCLPNIWYNLCINQLY